MAASSALPQLQFNWTHHLERWGTPGTEQSQAGWRDGSWYSFHNRPYKQLPEMIPALAPFYTDAELNFDPGNFVVFAALNYPLVFGIVTAYAVLVFGGQYLMKGWPAFDLQRPLALWNLALSVFSTMGMLRVVPHLLYNLYTHGLAYTICAPAEQAYGSGATGLWVMLFIFSKIPELFDTAFIVLRKKKLLFLHWYHHITVLLYCWDSYASYAAPGLWFIAMNYTVHAIMYFYFFLTACGYRPSWAPLVTTLQISQMAVGVMVCTMVYLLKFRGADSTCDVSDINFLAGLAMYASYFVLFGLFALKRYCSGSAPRSSAAKAKAGSAYSGKLAGSPGGWAVEGGVITPLPHANQDSAPSPGPTNEGQATPLRRRTPRRAAKGDA